MFRTRTFISYKTCQICGHIGEMDEFECRSFFDTLPSIQYVYCKNRPECKLAVDDDIEKLSKEYGLLYNPSNDNYPFMYDDNLPLVKLAEDELPKYKILTCILPRYSETENEIFFACHSAMIAKFVGIEELIAENGWIFEKFKRCGGLKIDSYAEIPYQQRLREINQKFFALP